MAKNPIPVLSEQPTAKSPKTKGVDKKKWAFSFRYWKQINYFGLDRTDSSWFVSLIDKLSELSKESIDGFIKDSSLRDQWRFHDINWKQRNIPIQRSELNWIDSDYLDNDEEFPLQQFQISQSLGRVVGFFDEAQTFNIVLLDPLHNIQPTKSYNYRVDYCAPLNSPYSLLLCQLDEIKKTYRCFDPACQFSNILNRIETRPLAKNVVMHFVDDMTWAEAQTYLDAGYVSDVCEIFQWGVNAVKDMSTDK
ncbi:hypothetical protein [Duffyella gerundensis]|uniref:hypothetical protein n=1 Tax=Duffyella gerundensis TaxID=1619313 RepID=UPI0016541431|nr:hypothetical protein [Duffyella gerundensis]